MTPEQRKRLDRITSRPMGLPAARELAKAMQRQKVRERSKADPHIAIENERPESIFALVFLAVVVLAGVYAVAVFS